MWCHMEAQMHALMHGTCTQPGRGSDMISGCQTDFSVWNPLTSTVTYIFPFKECDVGFYGSIVARDLKCLPIQADNSLQTADCEREKQRHIFQLLFQRGANLVSLSTAWNVLTENWNPLLFWMPQSPTSLFIFDRHLSIPLSGRLRTLRNKV